MINLSNDSIQNELQDCADKDYGWTVKELRKHIERPTNNHIYK